VYVVISGGGKVGRSVAVDLLDEGHDVAIVERVADRGEELLRDNQRRFMVIHGDAGDVRYLEQARTDRADTFVATTRDDDDNFVACQLALTSFTVPRAIARVNSPRNEEIFTRMRIEAVSTTSIISHLLREELSVSDLIHLFPVRRGRLNLVELPIPADADPEGRRVAELALPRDSVLVAIYRGDEVIFPRGENRVLPGDQVLALAAPESENKLRRALTPRARSRR